MHKFDEIITNYLYILTNCLFKKSVFLYKLINFGLKKMSIERHPSFRFILFD